MTHIQCGLDQAALDVDYKGTSRVSGLDRGKLVTLVQVKDDVLDIRLSNGLPAKQNKVENQSHDITL